MKNKQWGFTLFELLVSISIIGLLTALAVVSFSAAQKRGRDVRRTEDMKAVQVAAEQYHSINSSLYPISYAPGSSVWTVNGQTVLSLFPIDPKTGNDQYDCSGGPLGPSNSTQYCCCAHLESSGTGNALSNNCNFGSGTRNYFCVQNQQ